MSLWTGWEHDGFRVRSRASSEQTLDERETIVFHRSADGRWLAAHEHLSPTTAGPA